MRLIDANKLKNKLKYKEFDSKEKVGWLEAYMHFMKMIEDEPTAYDTDKVVEQLEEHFNATDDKTIRLTYHHAVEIVKSGEIE